MKLDEIRKLIKAAPDVRSLATDRRSPRRSGVRCMITDLKPLPREEVIRSMLAAGISEERVAAVLLGNGIRLAKLEAVAEAAQAVYMVFPNEGAEWLALYEALKALEETP